jgi:hypothetical protein
MLVGSIRVHNPQRQIFTDPTDVSDTPIRQRSNSGRTIERERLRSLVDADIATARRLHADDFELIHPRGGTLSKEEYTANKDFKVLSFVPKTVDFPFRSTSLL